MRRRDGAAFISKLAGLPEDVTGHVPRMTIIGNKQILIHHPERLEQFTDQDVLIKLPEAKIRITGKLLEVKELMPSEIVVEGTITNVQFETKQGKCFG
ncbi:YabP/YqfC family sporulation protein [Domibacillus epiphyticus]|uniref:Sporulation protein YqfC n=1 Tax=Domibacillus epiphyticus TaxID=1714355 RepID=A0A1V2A9G8_9BACI|nr:YabP/YqfC family sporulation protein [Domibacillus epiphyticus]OMP67638.1 hypothetical protein BTO28_06765 [Domibacillus epiphyticus]